MALSSEDASRPLASICLAGWSQTWWNLIQSFAFNSFHSDVDEPGSDILSGFGQMGACSLLRLHKQRKRETSMGQSEGVDLNKSYKHSMKVQGLVPLLFSVFGLDVFGFIHFSATLSFPQDCHRVSSKSSTLCLKITTLLQRAVPRLDGAFRCSTNLLPRRWKKFRNFNLLVYNKKGSETLWVLQLYYHLQILTVSNS